MIRVGLIARSNEKGLGYQTWSFAQNYPVASILHVTDANRRAPENLDRYPNAHHVRWSADVGFHTFEPVEAFLAEVDVVFSVETLYDWRIAKLKPTVVQGNPEFFRHHFNPDLPHPTIWTWPTTWKTDILPEGPVIPVPVPSDCWAQAAPPDDEVYKVIHIAGHRANGDRNGTDLFMQSLPQLRAKTNVRVYGQDGSLPPPPRVDVDVEVELHTYGVIDRWSMYDDAHVLVLPRRYGGLCLPVLEAATAGLAIVMTDCAPNATTWPIVPLRSGRGRAIIAPVGPINTSAVHPKLIGGAVRSLGQERARLYERMADSARWAAANTWDVLRPRYDQLFEDAVS